MRALPALILLLLAAGCPDNELTRAVKDFRHFSENGTAPPREDAVQAGEPVPIVVAERVVTEGERPRVDLALELPLAADPALVRGSLEAAVRGDEGRGMTVVRAVAWPGKLRHVVGPYGEQYLARDCKGLDGQGGCDAVRLAERFGGALRLEDTRVLAAVDRAMGEGKGEAAAIAEAARRTGLDEDAIEESLERARRLLPAP